jgi:glycosyltransferase involved in cell wall biosynthesis
MKVAFIALKDMPYLGGMEKYTEEIGKRLVADGDTVVVYTSGRNSKKCSLYKGMEIRPISTLHIKGIERFIVSRVATLIATFSNTDIIHFHSFENTLLSFIPKLFGKRIIYQGHGLEWERDRWGRIAVLYFKIINFIINKIPSLFLNKGTVVSNYQKNYYYGRYQNNFIWIPVGVNEVQRLPADQIKKFGLKGNDYIFFAARLVKEKGAHFLLKAYSTLKSKQKTNLSLVIAGDAPDEVEYISSLHELACRNTDIIFTGAISGDLLTEFYSNAVLFVLPSTIEGMPIGLMEAMSFEIPTLSSNIAPNLEATKNGKYGFHFENRDIQDLENKIIDILNNISIAKKKASEARVYVINYFTWDHIYMQFRDLYFNVLNDRKEKK